MSVDFTVICRAPLPSDFELFMGSRALPFEIGLDDPARLRDAAAAEESPDDLSRALVHALSTPASAVVQICCHSSRAELVELCCHELVERFGGCFFDDHTAELGAETPPGKPCTGQALVEGWVKLAADQAEIDRRVHALAQREHDAAAAKDPAAHAEADDWSDL